MFSSVKIVAKECFADYKRIYRLAAYEVRSQNSNTFFNVFWTVLNPAMQIGVYWFVFAIGLRVRPPQDGYPYIIWMMTGIIPWFFINSTLTGTATSFNKYAGIISNMALPLSIIPVKTVLSEFIKHFWAMLVVFLIFIVSGYWFSLSIFYLIYYAFAVIFLFIGYSLFASAINVLFPDFRKFLTSFVRLIFFISPVLWSHEGVSGKILFILRLNPFGYIIEGYRGSMLYNRNLTYNWEYGVYFWVFSFILLIIGCSVHCKFRNKFIDML